MSLQTNSFSCSQNNAKSLGLVINLIYPIPRVVCRTCSLKPGNSSSVTVVTKGATVPAQYPGKEALPLAFRPGAAKQSVWKAELPGLTHGAILSLLLKLINRSFATNWGGRGLHLALFKLKGRCCSLRHLHFLAS